MELKLHCYIYFVAEMPGISKQKATRRQNVALALSAKKQRIENQENVAPKTIEKCNQEIQVQPKMIDASVQYEDPVVAVVDADISGRRLVGLASLTEVMTNATHHASKCRKGPVSFQGTTKKGMATKVFFSCGCGKKFVNWIR